MRVYWLNDKLKAQLEDADFLVRKYDQVVAKKVAQRLREIGESRHYGLIPSASRKHAIKEGSNFLYFAVDVPGLREKRGKLRLLFRPHGEHDISRIETIVDVIIIGLKDYH
ncbi:MAG: hypothetical protein Q7T49_00350 [bacterium]|nr:hypothetical protein [bacterium]